jgi:hypothetical protein
MRITHPLVVCSYLDPKQIERGAGEDLQAPIAAPVDKSKDMNNFVWGCGCVSMDTSQENLLTFKEMCLNAAALAQKEN